jgi:hypothetical protein
MVGFAEVNMADIHVIVLVIGMETCVNTQKLITSSSLFVGSSPVFDGVHIGHLFSFQCCIFALLNTQKLTELGFVSTHSKLLGVYMIYLSHICLHLWHQSNDHIDFCKAHHSNTVTTDNDLSLKTGNKYMKYN